MIKYKDSRISCELPHVGNFDLELFHTEDSRSENFWIKAVNSTHKYKITLAGGGINWADRISLNGSRWTSCYQGITEKWSELKPLEDWLTGEGVPALQEARKEIYIYIKQLLLKNIETLDELIERCND